MKRLFPIACAAMLLSSCQNMPEPYAPPTQRQPFENFRPYRIKRMVNATDPDADAHIVKDILGLGGSWRWTNQRPTVKIRLRTIDDLKYIIDFSLADATMKDTGPVTVSFFVNDHLLSQVHYEKHGDYHYEKAVPREWLEPDKDTILAAEVDKVWVSKEDGVKLGMILSRMGLTQ